MTTRFIWEGKKPRIRLRLLQDDKIRGGWLDKVGVPNWQIYYQAAALDWIKEGLNWVKEGEKNEAVAQTGSTAVRSLHYYWCLCDGGIVLSCWKWGIRLCYYIPMLTKWSYAKHAIQYKFLKSR